MATSTTTTTATSTANPLRELSRYGQSAWLDYIRRNLLTSGELNSLVDNDGLGGVTSNPAIFEKAITGSTDYAEALVELQKRKDLDAMGVYEIIAIKDIQDAADILRPVYDRTNKRDGYMSLEVSPFLAKDTEGTLKDARRLWKAVNRPNLLVKVPATIEGIAAIEQLISEGISINVTLLFALEMYEKVAFAYISGIKKYVASGGDPSHVASVASFFISRIDSMVDSMVKAS
jgi:transaldolase